MRGPFERLGDRGTGPRFTDILQSSSEYELKRLEKFGQYCAAIGLAMSGVNAYLGASFAQTALDESNTMAERMSYGVAGAILGTAALVAADFTLESVGFWRRARQQRLETESNEAV